jgi:hypothetical protein
VAPTNSPPPRVRAANAQTSTPMISIPLERSFTKQQSGNNHCVFPSEQVFGTEKSRSTEERTGSVESQEVYTLGGAYAKVEFFKMATDMNPFDKHS